MSITQNQLIDTQTLVYASHINMSNQKISRAELKELQERWEDGIDLDTCDKKDIRQYIEYKTIKYNAYDLIDDEIWDQFCHDFASFTAATF